MSNNDNNNDNYQSRNRRSGNPHFAEPQSEPAVDYDEEPHHPIAWTFMAIVLLIVLIGLAFGFRAYTQARHSFGGTFQDDGIGKSRNVSGILKKRKPFSILLMGTDTGALGRHDVGRTDTIIVATVNPQKETTYLTSIPRDTKVVVNGDSQPYEKINAAYTIGGPKTAISTVQDLLNVPIDYFAIVNMGGLKQMVNSVGGVDVKPPLTFKYGNANVVKGKMTHLDGDQALDYSRMRDDDPKGDYGRQQRQRQILEKLVMKGMGISSIPRYQQILESLNGNLKTDLSFDDMIAIRAKYGPATHHIKSETLQGNEAMINGISYQVAQPDELMNVSNHIRTTLNLDPAKGLTSKQQQTNSPNNGNGGDQANNQDSSGNSGSTSTIPAY
ncbi:LCP family glycopolymer transferase [Fructilactobacillus fructivorans]|uniref:LytR family transcriptional regulator n=1 Tax=Fructilactobacillus fructivorans TaxID=1614 RepID=A0AAE6TWM1_9LACO|nr:LCP family protein [Fructilactobacillus fructivorans]KRK57687.1 transcriptional regulator [Fructilactobacillus fructivorans]QFX93031.1 LytR family transcriptional regulator [Fructilactobacillus fructivorans]RDV65366.1 LytR family transcriptional regulator [Fructilactobacillus fructivorans]